MSAELAKEARSAMKRKAERMATGDPHAKVDASSWTPSEDMKNDVKTGLRPLSRRQFKRGGKVEGEEAKARADRKPRGDAQMADAFVNRDVREANEERDGEKHVGGFARGGRSHKADGGDAGDTVPTERMAFQSGASRMSKAAGLASGGHADAAADKAMIRREVKPGALKRKHGGRADAHWISGAIKHPGALHRELNVADDKRIPEKKLEKAEHSGNKLVAKRAHLAETLRGLGHEKHDGGRVARKDGGRTGKGKMEVNIVIAPKSDTPPQMPPPDAAPPMPPPRPPMAPPMVGGPPPMGGLNGMPPGMPPQMPRKRGGRTMDAGAGSGVGRLEKVGLR